MVLYNDSLYICSQTHKSTNIFDASKFIKVGNGGGGGGSSQRYIGEWDLSQVNIIIDEAEPSPLRSSGYVKKNNDIFTYITSQPSFDTIINVTYTSYIAEGISETNSGIRSAVAYVPDNGSLTLSIVLSIQTNNTNITDFFNNFSSPNPALTGIFAIINLTTNNNIETIVYVVENGVFKIDKFITQFSVTKTIGSPIFYSIDTATGEYFLEINNTTYTLPNNEVLDLSAFSNDTFTSSYTILQGQNWNPLENPETFIFDLGTSLNGRLPFLSVKTELLPPSNISDGDVFLATNGYGEYLGYYIQENDYVEFLDNQQKLLITKQPPTDTQLRQLIIDEVSNKLEYRQTFFDKTKLPIVQYADFFDYSEVTCDASTEVLIIDSSSISVAYNVIRLPSFTENQYNGKRFTIVVENLTINNFGIYVGFATGDIVDNIGFQYSSITPFSVLEYIAVVKDNLSDTYWIRIR